MCGIENVLSDSQVHFPKAKIVHALKTHCGYYSAKTAMADEPDAPPAASLPDVPAWPEPTAMEEPVSAAAPEPAAMEIEPVAEPVGEEL